MRVTITITGAAAATAAIQAKVASIKDQANNAVQGAGINTQAYAKQACPVDTGRLRSSIQYTKTSESACAVGTAVSYALPVEMGFHTRLEHGAGGISKHTKGIAFVAPRPFLFPSYVRAKRELLAELKAIKV